ncbi:hypothetical protein FNJ47_08405 [Bradyrhizobium sp. UFLA 03-164]|uniref:Uncharacterized protein n=2 Tax=Nitrobacteraceae TaxID=41294 RepID=A0A6P1BBP6_9BRAD|nr:hypothetical protein [Bradyrhizobium oropedii]MCC8968307.1 hypothetical protein [Bradyrhizobium oropedii]MCC8983797.1 hypothetical protein [Bradyrhizobium acaciae]NEU95847.1 hypothetical protein [Bradyrhizobium uaiense]
MLSDPKATMQNDVPMETVWSILEAANELGDTPTVDACRRIIDANLRGDVPGQSDLNAVAAFFA